MATLRFGSVEPSRDSRSSLGRLSSATGTRTTKQEMQFFTERVERDRRDYISRACLSEVFVRRARETGDVLYYERAEEYARQALALRPRYAPALVQLAAANAAQHRFQDAIKAARKAFQLDKLQYDALLVVGDCQMALGEYVAAEQTFRNVQKQAPGPATSARLAHLAELRGDYDVALELIRSAAKVILDQRAPTEEVAWYQTLVGELYFDTERLDEAAQYFDAALTISKDYHVALAGLGKVRAAQGNLDQAIEFYKRAVQLNPQVNTLSALGDIYLRKADAETAQLYFNKIESMVSQPDARPDLLRRDLALFYADHDMNLGLALELAQADFKVRKDIFAYDALAWVLFKNYRVREAAMAIDEALKLGSRHPALCYHAGMIYKSQGDSEKAERYLNRAIARYPKHTIPYSNDARPDFSQNR